MRFLLIGSMLMLLGQPAAAQLLGGSASMNFLRLPTGALANALGGLALASDQPDLSLAFQNPSLLKGEESPKLHSSFLSLPGESKGYFLSGITSPKNARVVTALSLFYVDHGNEQLTDAGGNVLGRFRPHEWTLQASAAIPYKDRWQGGASLQFVQSSFGAYQSAAILSNLGIRYSDSARGWEAGAIFRHAGFFVRRHRNGEQPQLPLELAFGVWKKLNGSPFSVGATLQRMQRWQLETDELFDPALSSIGTDNRRAGFIGQFFNHLIFSARVDLHPAIKIIGAYNFLRRRELAWSGEANGLTGFSIGLQARLDRIELVYGRTTYRPGQSTHQLSVEFPLKKVSKGWKRE